MAIIRNAVRCNHCGTVVESRHRHDYRACNCEDPDRSVAVDGGLDYLRRAPGPRADFECLSEFTEAEPREVPPARIEHLKSAQAIGQTLQREINALREQNAYLTKRVNYLQDCNRRAMDALLGKGDL